MIEQSSIQKKDNDHQAIAVENDDSSVKTSEALASDSPKQVNEVQANEIQVNEVTEKIDNIQEKLKGFYHKFRS